MKHLTKKVGLFIVVLTAAFLFVTVTPMNTLGIENSSVAEATTKINTTKINLPKGSKHTLKITGTSKSVTWSTSKASVATVKNGVVTAKKAGSATITAKVGSKMYTCKVTVLNCKVNSNNVIMTKGKTYTLKISGTSKKAGFISGNTSVATVNKTSGMITAKKNGIATITVKVGSDSFPVTVKVERPSINKKNITLYSGKTYALKVSTSRRVTWSSNNTSVATVSGSGKVTAKQNGIAVITAKINDQSFTCTVKVCTTLPRTITVGWGQTITYIIKADNFFTSSNTTGNASCEIAPDSFHAGDTIVMKVTGNAIGNDTIILVFSNGLTRTIKVTVTKTVFTAYTYNNDDIFNNVTVNSFKAYKSAGTKPSFNVVGSITNTCPDKLSTLDLLYSFYDEHGEYIESYHHCIDNPVKGKTYNFSEIYKPSDTDYPEGATEVVFESISGTLVDSLKDSTVSEDVPTLPPETETGYHITSIKLKQSYDGLHNDKFQLDYNFTITNDTDDSDAYVYFFFFDKEGDLIDQFYDVCVPVTTTKGSSITMSGTLKGIYGGLKYNDIATVGVYVTNLKPEDY